MPDLNWPKYFEDICSANATNLEWGLPEPWVQTELFGLFQGNQTKIGWQPFETEIPYATYFPVNSPSHRNVTSEGAIKWIDLSLISKDRRELCWVELKVRKTGEKYRHEQASKDAVSAIKRDVVALIGMDRTLTDDAWVNPDKFTRTHWFKRVLDSEARSYLNTYQHRYVMVYLQLFGPLDDVLINGDAIHTQIEKWLRSRNKMYSKSIKLPELNISIHSKCIANEHSLVLIEWTK